MTDEILTRVDNGLGVITLNRPKAIHALNKCMCDAMIAALLDWRDDPAVQSVLIDHAGEDFGFGAHGIAHCRIISRAVITRMISLVPSRMRWTRRSRTMRSSG